MGRDQGQSSIYLDKKTISVIPLHFLEIETSGR